MSNDPSFMLGRNQASSPQGQSGAISKIEPQGVILDLGSGRVEVPLAQLQVDGRPAQVQDLRVAQVCVQEGGVWKVQPSPPACAVRGCTELAADGIALMKAKAMGTCQICGAPKTISSLMELPCPCVICEKCAISKVKETTNYSSCWLCNTPFSQTLSQSLYNKAGLSAAQTCIFCGGYLTEEGTKLECGDYTHPQCLYDWANQCLFSKPPQRVVCPCGIEVYADNFMEWFDNRKLQQVPSELALFFQRNPWEYEINCPRCGPESEALQISRKLDGVQPFTCTQCGYIFCVLCLESATDQFHAQGMCKYLVARSQIKELESAKQPAVQCSHCLLVQGKGTGWQECQFCKHYFCAECVMDYRVINSYGGSYHREDCPNFNPELISGAFCQDCPSRHVAGGDDACPQPKLLARKGQFAPSEKPETASQVTDLVLLSHLSLA